MSSDPELSSVASDDPIASMLELLDRIQQRDPEVAERALRQEIEEFLGKDVDSSRGEPDRPRPQSKTIEADPVRIQGVHAWYSQVASQTPAHDDERNWTSAHAVEVGLLARERLESSVSLQLSRQDLADLHTLKEEGEAAWRWLVSANLGLVFYWSRGIARAIDPDWAQDAFQAGCIGLIRGLERWDHTRGYKLSTFVSWHIRQAIERWRANDVLLIRVPVHVHDAMKSADDEVRSRALEAAHVALTLASLDADGVDLREETWDGGLADAANAWRVHGLLHSMLDTLSERESGVLKMRFGVGDDTPKTLDQIGDTFGVTRERIRQIERIAFEKLQELIRRSPSQFGELGLE